MNEWKRPVKSRNLKIYPAKTMKSRTSLFTKTTRPICRHDADFKNNSDNQ